MMNEQMAANQQTVRESYSVLATRGVTLPPGARVLHFGSGEGRHVREWREAGFDAVGVDQPVPYLTNAAPEHIYFSGPDREFPFESDTFDFCHSTSVLEHVLDYDRALSEIARVLKPGAYTMHIFPARWRPVEPHIFTPFGGRFQQPALIRLWARLGIRNSFQKGMTAARTAETNIAYSATGINYLTQRQIRESFERCFDQVDFVERKWVHAKEDASRVLRISSAVIGLPGMEAIYRGLHTRVVLAQKRAD